MKRVTVKLVCGHKKKLPEFTIDAIDGRGEVLCTECKEFRKIKS